VPQTTDVLRERDAHIIGSASPQCLQTYRLSKCNAMMPNGKNAIAQMYPHALCLTSYSCLGHKSGLCPFSFVADSPSRVPLSPVSRLSAAGFFLNTAGFSNGVSCFFLILGLRRVECWLRNWRMVREIEFEGKKLFLDLRIHSGRR